LAAFEMFGGPVEAIAMQVVAGRARDANQPALDQLRQDYRDVVIRGFDGVVGEAIARWDVRELLENPDD
jgi:hypothetical protein